ncbi:MAG: DUF1015 domain-containing protein [Deltaproteobacteria bacterium]|nr:DUF1015 domain-containing protein [Deltaproteobacteria bacterium]
MKLAPFHALTPAPDVAARLLSPPYDVMSREEAKALGADPLSFLRVTRAELAMADAVGAYAPEVYGQAKVALAALLDRGALSRAPAPIYGVYRLTRGPWRQTGLVGLAAVADYVAGTVKKHELTRPDKEDDRTRHIDVTGAQTGPVFLATRATAAFEAALVAVTGGAPAVDVTTPDGVRHEAWHVVAGSPHADALVEALAPMHALYIADGHHRAASAARVAALRGAPDMGFLAVVFPHDHLQILPYHRLVHDLGGLTPGDLLERAAASFHVGEPRETPPAPRRHAFGLLIGGAWRELEVRTALVDEADPIGSLDAAILQDRLLGPILGIVDPRRDQRIDFVGGIRGTAELERRVAAGSALAIAMAPTTLDELFRVADAGLIMPPKSTWFEPKLADGMFVHLV